MTVTDQTTYSTPVTETLNKHVTIRLFTDEPIPEGMLNAVLGAARRSPTSSNMQTYSIIVVRDQETKKKLAVLSGNQKHVETCDTFLAFCADIHRLGVATEMHDQTLAKSLETTLVSTVDASLVGMSVQTAAESFGLGAVMIGGMRNQPKEVAKLLGFPSGVYVVYGMCLGWPDMDGIPAQKPRLPENLVIHHEKYDMSDSSKKVQIYDQVLAEHYGKQNRNQHEAAWSGPIANRLNTTRRPKLRKTLEALGFSFD
ncbi:MAG: NADPH-dependent oxidoreductase [Chloroflexi bacterium]|nr:NADPH-dependent oxidoreductase [Chloroflexota bacterium]